MARGRAVDSGDVEGSIPVRTTPRKRKIVQYEEADSNDEDLSLSAELNGAESDSEEGVIAKKRTVKPNPKSTSKKGAPSPKSTPKRGKTAAISSKEEANSFETQPNGLAAEQSSETTASVTPKPSTPKGKGKKKAKVESPDEDADTATDEEPKPKRKRKTKEEKEAEKMPLAARTPGLKFFVGAHTSIAKGVENSITNSVHIGGNAFACFLKSQRKWDNPTLKDENREAFKQHLITHQYDATSHILPHGSYLVNLATADKDMAKKSYDAFLDDLKRCEALGIKHYNFHPGAAGQAPMADAIGRLASRLNQALSETHTVTPVLENMASRGSIIGGRFSDLRDVIALIKPEYQSRIGVCIDTCHAFASGYDLRTPEAFKKTLQEFDDTVGIKYLKALHLNDSKAPFASNRDLHQNIGLGFLGLRAFHNVMNESRFHNLPLILETPCDRPDPNDPKGKKVITDANIWATEIKLLESLTDMDPNGDKFKKLEKELSDRGKPERVKMQKQFDDKTAKTARKLAKEKEKGQSSLKDMFGGKKGKGAKAKTEDSESDLSDIGDED